MDNPRTNFPFMFDIGNRTFEFGREDFCLNAGFRFGNVSLNPLEEDKSSFRLHVFPDISNIKGGLLFDLVKNDRQFNELEDEDVVRVCLFLALDYVFMVQELKHVLSNSIVNLVDDFYAWTAFPWGEHMWLEFHKRVYNVVARHMKTHLKELAKNPKHLATYALYGFVFPFKCLSLEIGHRRRLRPPPSSRRTPQPPPSPSHHNTTPTIDPLNIITPLPRHHRSLHHHYRNHHNHHLHDMPPSPSSSHRAPP
ncbi:phospholipase-like protein [Tanacetum coccineum]|uniref:Phospholipase-like protein n=1 Tax=Tanacetum coccineum TaxID=301880 RepID=A0ABQ4XMR1_9ASTR